MRSRVQVERSYTRDPKLISSTLVELGPLDPRIIGSPLPSAGEGLGVRGTALYRSITHDEWIKHIHRGYPCNRVADEKRGLVELGPPDQTKHPIDKLR